MQKLEIDPEKLTYDRVHDMPKDVRMEVLAKREGWLIGVRQRDYLEYKREVARFYYHMNKGGKNGSAGSVRGIGRTKLLDV